MANITLDIIPMKFWPFLGFLSLLHLAIPKFYSISHFLILKVFNFKILTFNSLHPFYSLNRIFMILNRRSPKLQKFFISDYFRGMLTFYSDLFQFPQNKLIIRFLLKTDCFYILKNLKKLSWIVLK